MKKLNYPSFLPKNKFLFVLAFIFSLLMATQACKKEEVSDAKEKAKILEKETHFENQEGTIYFLEDDNQWAIRFVPDYMLPFNIDTEYFGIIDRTSLQDSLRVMDKKVIFSGSIKPNTTFIPDWTFFHAGSEFYDLNLESLKSK
jgi:hypothetical protein